MQHAALSIYLTCDLSSNKISNEDTLPLVKLVEQLYSHFMKTFFVGSRVYVRLDGVEKIICEVKARLTYPETLNLMAKESGKRPILVMNTSKDGYFYELAPVNSDEHDSVVYISHESMIKREKSSLHKKNFRKIIKTMAKKDIWVGAPWILRVLTSRQTLMRTNSAIPHY